MVEEDREDEKEEVVQTPVAASKEVKEVDPLAAPSANIPDEERASAPPHTPTPLAAASETPLSPGFCKVMSSRLCSLPAPQKKDAAVLKEKAKRPPERSMTRPRDPSLHHAHSNLQRPSSSVYLPPPTKTRCRARECRLGRSCLFLRNYPRLRNLKHWGGEGNAVASSLDGGAGAPFKGLGWAEVMILALEVDGTIRLRDA